MTALETEIAPVTFSEEHEMLRDWLTTAVEGGIGYWSVCTSYKWETLLPDEVHASVVEQDASTTASPIRVGLSDLRGAMNRIIAEPAKCAVSKSHELRKALFVMLFDLEAGSNWLDLDCDYDATWADMVFQVAALGSVIYG